MVSNLLLILELGVADLRSTRFLILHLLLLLDGVQADPRDLNRVVFQSTLILPAFSVLSEHLIAELAHWDALDASVLMLISLRPGLSFGTISGDRFRNGGRSLLVQCPSTV